MGLTLFQQQIKSFKSLEAELALLKELNIRNTDIVLDIGSGEKPNLRANVLCDKFISDSSERAHHSSVFVDQRPFIVGDGESLPFKDKSFDYVICSHVIEHVENPSIFLQELQRVAKRGYIETPHPTYEKMIGGVPFHKWFVSNDNGRLIIERKAAGVLDNDLRTFFRKVLTNGNIFGEFLVKNLRQLGFVTQYKWESEICYTIVDVEKIRQNSTDDRKFVYAKTEGTDVSLDAERTRNPIRRRIKRILSQWLRRYSDQKCGSLVSLLEILSCPICKSEFLLSDQDVLSLVCSRCQQEYTVVKHAQKGYIINLLPTRSDTPLERTVTATEMGEKNNATATKR